MGMMISTKDYRAYRDTYVALNSRILDTALPHDLFVEAGRRLGLLREGIFVFKDEEQPNVVADFALHELTSNGVSPIEAFRAKNDDAEGVEKEILEGLSSASTSLFRIETISPSEDILVLSDLLNDKQGIRLMDIAFSRSAVRGLVMFTRLVAFKHVFMTSGFSFIFPPEMQRMLLRKYRRHFASGWPADDPAERFVFFFKENELYGQDVFFA
ncbi:MAG TPA: hypothetical protein ENO03_04380 [Candidatus Aminicenantes bacterium]|nr:hypothetical protein [Candidatus Aminicenantes bacterium]HDT13574.1 hypothetical protein [Candidatus Aminicenantes bacterium]